jgi:hypothetical protein
MASWTVTSATASHVDENERLFEDETSKKDKIGMTCTFSDSDSKLSDETDSSSSSLAAAVPTLKTFCSTQISSGRCSSASPQLLTRKRGLEFSEEIVDLERKENFAKKVFEIYCFRCWALLTLLLIFLGAGN